MRVTLARAAAVVAALSAFTLLAGPVAAGGPTSALLSIPGAGSTASLYYTDPEYDELARLVGMSEPNGTFEGKESGSGHESGPGVTVTWLIHDVDPWRVDRVYPTQDGAPWIATQTVGEDGGLWNSPVVWHQPENGGRLMVLLDDLGVSEAARATDDFAGVAGDQEPAPDEAANAPAAVEPAAAESGGSAGTWWALGGVLVGVLATLCVTRLRRREHPVVGSASEGDPESGVREELAWPTPRR